MDITYLLVPGGYLFGSVSTAIIVCKLMGLPDPRSTGSRNPGATNVARIGGKKAAALTLAGDMLKGLIPVLIAHALQADALVLAGTALAAFLGHLYPVFFGFKGGKGVATALGIQFGLHWTIGAAVGATWLLMAKIGNISSLAALISMLLAPLYVWLVWPSGELITMQILITLLLFWRHRGNIRNILQGREGRISGDKTG
jgi:acyl phosphate:glycerol-3-phosphate acyltransferase